MTREDKPATLADQAASWVPPWARQPEPEPEPAGPGGSAVDVASADVAGAATEDAEPMAGEEMAAGEAAAVEAAGPHGESAAYTGSVQRIKQHE